MFFKKKKKSSAADFWNWFSQNHQQFLFVTDTDQNEKNRMMDEMLVELHKFSKGLFFEIGSQKDTPPEVVITANGNVEFFDQVEELIAAAPKIGDWIYTAFKQPMGNEFGVDYGGIKFDPSEIQFIPLFNEEAPNDVGIHICYPGVNDQNKEIYIGGTYILLDTILGEKSTTLDITYMDIIPTPEDNDDGMYKKLSEIKEFIDMVKGR